MWCVISMNDNLCTVCTVRNSLCVCWGTLWGKRRWGAAVIKDINNLLWTAWLRTQAPNGDKAGVSRCSEGNHAGHIHEVPQKEYSPSMYIAQSCANCKEEFQLMDYILQVLLRKLISKKSQLFWCQWMHKITCNDKISSCPFPCTMCHVITGV